MPLLLVMEHTKLLALVPHVEDPTKWRKEGDRWVIPERQSEFLDWLLTPRGEREIQTVKEWAEGHDLTPATVSGWKGDRRFRREWEDRANSKNLSVERMQGVIDTLYQAAMDGDVQAAKLYIQETEKLRPPRQVTADADVEKLSDEELADELRLLLGDVRGFGESFAGE